MSSEQPRPSANAGSAPWYRRRSVVIPIGTGVLGVLVGTSAAPPKDSVASTAQVEVEPVAGATTTVTVTAPPSPPAAAPVTRTVTRTVTPTPRTVRVTVTTTPTIQSLVGGGAGGGGGGSTYYANCSAARAAGAAPIQVGEPGYRAGLDRDGDGVACE